MDSAVRDRTHDALATSAPARALQRGGKAPREVLSFLVQRRTWFEARTSKVHDATSPLAYLS